MRSSWLVMLTFLFGMVTLSQAAEAARLGGGSSFGYSKTIPSKSYSTAPKSTATKPAATTGKTTATSGASKWLGPLAGLAAGGLLAAMLFGDGFEGIQLMDMLIFALIAYMLFKLFASSRSRQQPIYGQSSEGTYQSDNQTVSRRQAYSEFSGQPNYDPYQEGSIIGSALGEGISDQAVTVHEVPAWFNAQQFVEGAKGHFVTLQKAWDDLDLKEVESYCTPELFAEIKQQAQGRVPGDNVTVVDTLDAEIADMAIDGDYFVVSVRFSGFIQEEAEADAHAFNEVWHIRRDASDQGNWLVAGIQQMH
ncbi:Tim44-like domain-containing protein [Thiomicrorhabdus sp. ZW0627]|uniref:Tim44 domain-containing protein n=1 Tax=Thiomicrorhabdus sp. ZW0627 TaxID=3039774 RepID=UPI0024374243|nr:Tim44-like domain-containing protein [Thiomicrorhabdus sp. ZW0627]MDG6774462.1 Tim44-like domain-containing protein [Thiomicrorhabdus sp. ZW0627]